MQTMYTIPKKHTPAPFGTICKVIGNDNEETLYIQLSEDKSCANWQLMSFFMDKVFKRFYNDQQFITECLKIVSNLGTPSMQSLSIILKNFN